MQLKFNFRNYTSDGNENIYPFLIHIPFESNLFLAECIKIVVQYPFWLIQDNSKGIIVSDEITKIVEAISINRQVEMAWFGHLVFNRGKLAPNILKSPSFSQFQLLGRRSEARLKVIEYLCETKKDIFTDFFTLKCTPEYISHEDWPAWIWLWIENGISLEKLRNARVGFHLCIPYISPPRNLIGKDKVFKQCKHYLDLLEDKESSFKDGYEPAINSWSILNSLVLKEAKFLVQGGDEIFNQHIWEPYLKLERACNNFIRKSKNAKTMILDNEEKIFVLEKNKKIPSKCNGM